MIENKYYNWTEIEEYVQKKIPDSNYYADLNSLKPSYTIIMPPPNVTGALHIGHALVTTLQDVLVRYKRMKGYNVLWQPGLDHAGIATQVLVEKQLKEKNLDRRQLGREKFLEKVYEWKEASGNTIIDQIRKMGSSCDFSNVAFTMDNNSIAVVNQAFVKMYEAGLIYKDYRLVNWDCSLQTAISDLEVETKETPGYYYYLKYYLSESNEYLVIATTRPETLFGDVAVAVNKADPRYEKFIGKEVLIPLINKKVPIIADDYADINKGSGAVKITPAHDFNDFELGKRHKLSQINILNKDGTLNNNVPNNYRSLSIVDARKKILIELEEKNLIEKIESAKISTPYGDRSNTVIQPLLTKQWFLDAQSLALPAIKAVQEGSITFIPEQWKNLYFDWMEKIEPWCISRQLWWGHRIPVWYDEEGNIFVAPGETQAKEKAADFYRQAGIIKEIISLTQDEDVLDTWFSSGLWPLITLGWPNDLKKLNKYYPTDILVTAFDIIFFWVARMIMMSLFLYKEVPFKKIYINALIRDEKGNKMSKSKGNVIDPLDILNKYGTDALRFTLVYYSAQSRDMKLAEKTIESHRNFITKIWNSFKFCSQNEFYINDTFNPNKVSLSVNQWILAQLETFQKNIDIHYDNHRFNDIATTIYQFVWGEFCDWYIEFAKSILYNPDILLEDKNEIKATMGFVFENILKIIHPVMPFISQYLYEALYKDQNKILALEAFPNFNFNLDKVIVNNVNKIIEIVAKIRSIRVDLNISPAVLLDLGVQAEEMPTFIIYNLQIIKKLARVGTINLISQINSSMIEEIVGEAIIAISVEGIVDLQKEKNRLNKNQVNLKEELEKINLKLDNSNFLSKAQPSVIELFQNQKREIIFKLEKLENILNKINI
ncbi:Valine--tRNA ligase [Candidatus Hepatincolaceae symbiont of Richtersius coronifer]